MQLPKTGVRFLQRFSPRRRLKVNTVAGILLLLGGYVGKLQPVLTILQDVSFVKAAHHAHPKAIDFAIESVGPSIFVLGLIWLTATMWRTIDHLGVPLLNVPRAAISAESQAPLNGDLVRLGDGPSHQSTLMMLHDGSTGAIAQHDPALERIRDLYPFVKDAVFAANDFLGASFDRLGLDPGTIGSLFLNLLDASVRCDAILAVGRLERALATQELEEPIEAKLKRSLLAYGTFASYIHRAGPILAGEEHFYGSSGYAKLYNAHRDLLVALKAIRGRFDWISQEIGILQSFFEVSPRTR